MVDIKRPLIQKRIGRSLYRKILCKLLFVVLFMIALSILQLAVTFTITGDNHYPEDRVESIRKYVKGPPSPKVKMETAAYQSVGEDDSKPCAILFFGVVKSFNDLILPSIRQNIINTNPHCDVFLHTYNLSTVPFNPRNGKSENQMIPNGGMKLNASEAILLTENITIQNDMNAIYDVRADAIDRIREKAFKKYGECCISSDNMIKQWHSINEVWDLMKEHEQNYINLLDHNGNAGINGRDQDRNQRRKSYYKRVGLFRSDVYYVNPIKISNPKEEAVVPNFASFGGYNDRLFYGSYANAEVWASKRFEFMETFEEDYMYNNDRFGYHSETYLSNLLKHHNVPATKGCVCTWRVRAGSKVKVTDCVPPQHVKKVNGAKMLMASLDVNEDAYDDDYDLSVRWIEYTLDYLPSGFKLFADSTPNGVELVDFYAAPDI